MKSNDFSRTCDLYLQHGKHIKNFQPATLKGYRDTFALFEKMTGVTSIESLSKEKIERFLYDGRIDRKWSACTFRTYHKRIRSFCNWLVKKDLIPNNYTDEIDKPPLGKRLSVEPSIFLLMSANILYRQP